MSNTLNQKCKLCLECVAKKLMSKNKIILALDNLLMNVENEFPKVCIENTEETRRKYRQLFLTSNPVYGTVISGVIFQDEAFAQKTDEGKLFTEVLRKHKILTGICANIGTHVIDMEQPETVPLLDMGNLNARCAAYRFNHYDFAKLETTFIMSSKTPTAAAIRKNAFVMSMFAAFCQKHTILPLLIIKCKHKAEYNLQECSELFKTIFHCMQTAFCQYDVYREGLLLATNIISDGKDMNMLYTAEQIAAVTLDTLRQTVPPAVAGILLLFEEKRANICVDIINKINSSDALKPWPITFIFGALFQKATLREWSGKERKLQLAKLKYLEYLRACFLAQQGIYNEELDPFNDLLYY